MPENLGMLNVLSFSTFCSPGKPFMERKPPISLLFLTFRRSIPFKLFQHTGLPSNGLQSHATSPPLSMTRTPDAPYGVGRLPTAEFDLFETPRIGRPYDVANRTYREIHCLCLFSGIRLWRCYGWT